MGIKRRTEVLIVGAGPVGLFAALSLAERGVEVQIIDKEWRGSLNSYAVALHPQTLRLLDECGVLGELMSKGHRIDKLAFYDGQTRMAELDYSKSAGPFNSMLVVPQCALEQALEAKLKQKKIKVFWNYRAQVFEEGESDVTVTVAQMEKASAGYPIARSEWMILREHEVCADFVMGADGYHSRVRDVLGFDFKPQGKSESFAVFEFPGQIDFPHEGRVVFHDDTTNVVWPISEDRGRWNFQVDAEAPVDLSLEHMGELIRARAPWFRPEVDRLIWTAVARFDRMRATEFGRKRIWLAGDAAHITGPVGAQSMNVGIREAHDLAERFSALIKTGGSIDSLGQYAVERQEEWAQLQDMAGVTALPDAPPWASEFVARILPCIPASGADLEQLLEQIGMHVAGGVGAAH